MSLVHHGHLFADDGQIQTRDASAGVPAAAKVNGCWAHHADGSPYIEDLVAAAVPAGSIRNGGLSFHPDGRLYVTTQAVVGADSYLGCYRVRTDGALRISTAAVGATDIKNAGWAFAQTGEARMQIVL
jgi:hypothetical protein